MSDRPTQTPASSAPPPQASGGSLAARAARFRSGSPFLVERATLYDPDPLDLPVAPAERRRDAPRTLLPAALTLLGVVVVVGLAAGILFVRNPDGPRTVESRVRDQDGGAKNGENRGTGRLGQFSEPVVPRSSPVGPSREVPSHQAPGGREQITYDLTRRSTDTIVGAWRAHKEVERQPVEEAKPVDKAKPAPPVAPAPEPEAPSEVVSPATDTPPRGLQRLMPRRLTGWLAKRKADQIAGPVVPPRAPLDEPHVPKVPTEFRPVERVRAPLDEPHVPKVSADGRTTTPMPAARDTASVPQRGPAAAGQRATPAATERPGSNVVARVGRATDPKESTKPRDATGPESAPPDAEKPSATRERYTTSSARRAELRRLRDARRQAVDLDRFLLRDKGEIPRGFVFSGPQAQRP